MGCIFVGVVCLVLVGFGLVWWTRVLVLGVYFFDFGGVVLEYCRVVDFECGG